VFGSGSRRERVLFVSRFVFRADADGPQATYRTLVFTNAATGASCGINVGFLQAHFNENPAAGRRRHCPRPGDLQVLAGIVRDQPAFAGGAIFQPDKIIACAQRAGRSAVPSSVRLPAAAVIVRAPSRTT